MKFLQISTLWLALFLLVGAGCGEQKQKSKERGQAIVDTVKDAEKNINDKIGELILVEYSVGITNEAL
jgi:hypothetical protein